MGADSLSQLCTWVDAAYGVHPDLKSHTGGCTSFGYGIVHCNYRKKKLKTNFLTKAKVVGVSDYLPYNIWICLFTGAQGYDIKQKLFQDNQSAIKKKKNGKKLRTGKSRHFDIRYFFDKDRVGTNKMSIAYCGKEYMLADFFTKYLQGYLFAKFCDVLMEWKHVVQYRPV